MYFLAAVSVSRTSAAAPSLRVLALAAVMVPPSSSGLKAGLRPGNFVKSALKQCVCVCMCVCVCVCVWCTCAYVCVCVNRRETVR